MKPMLVTTLAVLATAVAGGAFAQGANYLARYDGGWSGGGSVKVEQLPTATNVNCDVQGTRSGETAFALQGTCRSMLIMSREIGAQLKIDPSSGNYSGTYTGSASGPARLLGSRQGDTLDLQVTWGRVIYDDNKARMLIRNTGNDTFRMQVIEKIEGADVTVSDLSFQRG
ncbi:MAG: hypothetical protein V7704_16830 [Aurantimonas endophytica]|uniref:Uncharacterized protein n=1 Tax=Aurantimonas endophytica TaxID=1522175 RepID=A0A7W6MNE5_9HYPH|nr:hypothetical protein [Aurantimonas endophytica]MBB4001805.1 hypothetical protein [Aurantimonas endophytica]MCO6402558.1 hypothetical protein [Aurantimonas endophytica]